MRSRAKRVPARRSKARARSGAGAGAGAGSGAARGTFTPELHPRDAQGHWITTGGGQKHYKHGTREQRARLAGQFRAARQGASRDRHSEIAQQARNLRAARHGRPTPAHRPRGAGRPASGRGRAATARPRPGTPEQRARLAEAFKDMRRAAATPEERRNLASIARRMRAGRTTATPTPAPTPAPRPTPRPAPRPRAAPARPAPSSLDPVVSGDAIPVTRLPAGRPAPARASASPAATAPARYDKSKASVRVQPEERADLDKRSRALFGRVLEDRDWASLAGAPDHATVQVSTTAAGMFDHTTVSISWQTPEGMAHRSIEKKAQGTIIHNHTFFLNREHQGSGIGLDVFGRQVEQGREMGAVEIHTHAARSREMNGYYTWARFGYDAEIPESIRYKAGREFPGARRVSDLMATKEGRDWWKTHGTDLYAARFDLKPGSRSSQDWADYLAERKARARP